MKSTTIKLVDAVELAFSQIEELAGEIRETVDNASEAMSATQRIQTLSDTADTLENWTDRPEIPKVIEDLLITYQEYEQKDLGSRAKRRDAACEIISGTVQGLHEWLETHDEFKETDHYSDVDNLADQLDGAKGEWEYVEFPGFGKSA